MKEAQNQFLRLLGQVPARLTAEQTHPVLNCQSHNVPVLRAAHLLKPPGSPEPNSVKFFATSDAVRKVEGSGVAAEGDQHSVSALAAEERCEAFISNSWTSGKHFDLESCAVIKGMINLPGVS